ncbi:MAG: hypothetical protein ACLTFB_00885 [Candidatus Phytoplasma pyri]
MAKKNKAFELYLTKGQLGYLKKVNFGAQQPNQLFQNKTQGDLLDRKITVGSASKSSAPKKGILDQKITIGESKKAPKSVKKSAKRESYDDLAAHYEKNRR